MKKKNPFNVAQAVFFFKLLLRKIYRTFPFYDQRQKKTITFTQNIYEAVEKCPISTLHNGNFINHIHGANEVKPLCRKLCITQEKNTRDDFGINE